MKYFSRQSDKRRSIVVVLLIIVMIIMLGLSTNMLFVSNKLSAVVQKVPALLGINEQTTLTDISDIDDYFWGALTGALSTDKFPLVDMQVKQEGVILLNSDRENGGRSFVPASFLIRDGENVQNIKGKIRVKGDRKLHQESFAKMSFRVNLKGDDRLFGLEEFSIQDPVVRGYTWEFLIANIFSDEGLISLQSRIAKLSFNGEQRGLYVFEEVPSKVTVERNQRKSGPIFGLNEDFGVGIDSVLDVYDYKDWSNSALYLNAKELLLSQFAEARNGRSFSSEVFDVDEWAKYFALTDLFGSHHASVPKSVKFYYNPVIGKFQPVLFDAHKGAGLFTNYILADFKLSPRNVECEWTCPHRDFYLGFLNNRDFYDAYVGYLQIYSDETFLQHIEARYKQNYEGLDRKFYSSLRRTDGIFFRGFGLYYFKFSEIEKRATLLEQKVARLHEHADTFVFSSATEDQVYSIRSGGRLEAANGASVLNFSNQMVQGSRWNFEQPTVLLLTGNTILKGQSKESPLTITGPVMIVQEGGSITLQNVRILQPINITVPSRQWSGAVNIIDAKTKIDEVSIEDSIAEDAINLISSTYEINGLVISGSKSDAVDFDFSDGQVTSLICRNIGNDCLDASESQVHVGVLFADGVQDKGVSAGENSKVRIEEFDAINVAVGLVSKDGSTLEVGEYRLEQVQLAISAYQKKPEYKPPSLIVERGTNYLTPVNALVSPDSKVQIPEAFNIIFEASSSIESRMYGAEFGKATEK